MLLVPVLTFGWERDYLEGATDAMGIAAEMRDESEPRSRRDNAWRRINT